MKDELIITSKHKIMYQKSSQCIRYSLRISILFLISYVLCLMSAPSALAGPTDGTYQLIDYGVGSGGTMNSSDGTYQLQAIAGELEMGSPSSLLYTLLPGLTYTLEANVPPAPNFTNAGGFGGYYNKLQLTINQGNNPADVTYAIAVSTDGFVNNIKYVQSDGTLGNSLVFQTYAAWGTPVNIIGLTQGTTYYARVAARKGTFQQGPLGPTAIAATVNASFSYNLQTSTQASPPYTVGIGVINAGQVTTSWQKIIATISTNARNGGTIYINGTNAGLKSPITSANHLIPSVQNDLSSGGVTEGYGARGVSVSANTGTMELLSPYNLGGNNVGPVDTSKTSIADSSSAPVDTGVLNFELKAKASSTTPAATDYTDTITVVASGSF